MLILGGISGAGMMTLLEDYRPIFMVVTFGLLGSAFYMTYRPRYWWRVPADGGESGRAPAVINSPRSKVLALNKIMLWAVTAMVVVFLFVPQVVTSLSASGSGFTADMQRTVIQIEGMT